VLASGRFDTPALEDSIMMLWKKTAFVVTTVAWVPAAWASITFGQAGDRTACPDPTFGAC
jgi:hypothetical protein